MRINQQAILDIIQLRIIMVLCQAIDTETSSPFMSRGRPFHRWLSNLNDMLRTSVGPGFAIVAWLQIKFWSRRISRKRHSATLPTSLSRSKPFLERLLSLHLHWTTQIARSPSGLLLPVQEGPLNFWCAVDDNLYKHRRIR